MAAIVFFMSWRHKSRDSTPCNWNTWRYCLFCCYYRHGRRVSSLCQITERLLFFRRSTEPLKRLLNHHIYGHTHHWSHRRSIVVRLHAEPLHGSGNCFVVPVGRTYNWNVDTRIYIIIENRDACISNTNLCISVREISISITDICISIRDICN